MRYFLTYAPKVVPSDDCETVVTPTQFRFHANMNATDDLVKDCDLHETIANMLTSSKGYRSQNEPLQLQFLTVSLARGTAVSENDCDVGMEVGSCKLISMLAILEIVSRIVFDGAHVYDSLPGVAVPTHLADILQLLRFQLTSFRFMKATFEPVDDLASLAQRYIAKKIRKTEAQRPSFLQMHTAFTLDVLARQAGGDSRTAREIIYEVIRDYNANKVFGHKIAAEERDAIRSCQLLSEAARAIIVQHHSKFKWEKSGITAMIVAQDMFLEGVL